MLFSFDQGFGSGLENNVGSGFQNLVGLVLIDQSDNTVFKCQLYYFFLM